ncbi:hypothetical protein HMPREF9081_0645 [Centipeda periodontii DSM 2778]|uniref:Uncharacterized protein n=1 Tax=Centipeda periodontii DSM 2778 TaxID=888060 RepID=F5RK60_9FIRM|nr:hypothetical protein HMPREF9081_0645 [Centipeda periodontii DSM 2778]
MTPVIYYSAHFSEMCYSIISAVCIYNWSLCLRRSKRPFHRFAVPLPRIGGGGLGERQIPRSSPSSSR